MFLRPYRVAKDGKDHTYWSLVETVRTPDGDQIMNFTADGPKAETDPWKARLDLVLPLHP